MPTEHVGANVGTFAGVQFDNPVGKGTGNLGPVQYFHVSATTTTRTKTTEESAEKKTNAKTTTTTTNSTPSLPLSHIQAKSGHAAFVPASMLHKVSADSLSLFS